MKIKFTVLVVCFIVLSGFLYAQPKDLPGYKNTRWGMTEQEIKDAMKEEAVPLKSKKSIGLGQSYSTIGLKNISIDSNDFIGYFVMNKETDRLTQVNLEIIAQNIDDNYDSFNSMVKELSKEYGKPTALYTSIYPEAKRPIAKAVWMFPSTIIFYISWGKDLDKSMLQFFHNDGRKTLKSLGFIPEEPKKEDKEKIEKKEEVKSDKK